jgi:four helix bundle protein
MLVEKFEDLIVWQKGQDLAVHVYKTFTHIKDYDFKNQIFRASVSVSNNIAEGFERDYNQEFIRFLRISKGSCGEVRSMSYLAARLEFIAEEEKDQLIYKCKEESKILSGLIKSIKV